MVSKTFITSALVAAVSAHQNLHEFFVNGVSPGYEVGIRKAPSNSPVEDVTSNDMACNVDGSKVPSGVETIEAKEGDSIKVSWDVSSHPGPITHFLFGPVDDASQATGIGEWFKIDMLNYEGGKWANEIMQSNASSGGMTHEFKLPTGLQSGEYLLRSEMLALHGAQTVGGAQFYIGCMQLKITGTGSGTCGPTIEIPGTYKAEDDNIYIPNVYNGFDPTTYTAPGGPVATCGGSGSAPSTPTTSAGVPSGNSTLPTTAPEAPVSSAAPVESAAPEESDVAAPEPTIAAPEATDAPEASAPAASAPAASAPPAAETPIEAPVPSVTASFPAGNGTLPTAIPTGGRPTTLVTSARPQPSSGSGAGGAKKYYQCGGQGWTGATTCESGLTCTAHNDYYHQCL